MDRDINLTVEALGEETEDKSYFDIADKVKESWEAKGIMKIYNEISETLKKEEERKKNIAKEYYKKRFE